MSRPSLVLISMFALSVIGLMLVGGTAAQDIPVESTEGELTFAVENSSTSERSILTPELQAGETTTVSISVQLDGPANFTIVETFDPAFAEVEIVEDDGAAFSAVTDAGDAIFATWGASTNATLEVAVSIPSDASADTTYDFEGALDVDGTVVATGGDATIVVVADDPPPVFFPPAPDDPEPSPTPTPTPEPTPTPAQPAQPTPTPVEHTPTATPDEMTPTPVEPTPEPTPPADDVPGFGIFVGLMAILAVAWSFRRSG